MSKERGRIIRCALALSSELELKRAGLDLGEVMAILAEVRGSCCRRTAYRWIAEFTDLGAYEWKHGLLRKRRIGIWRRA